MLWRSARLMLLLGCMIGGHSGLVMASEHSGDQRVKATVLIYRKFPSGRESYLSRLLVTSSYMRFDNGHQEGDFLLFNRHDRTIYSVDNGDHTVLVIPPRPVKVRSPIPLKLMEKHESPSGAPEINGHHAVHYTFYANGKRCVDVMVVPHLLNGVRKALMSYKVTLAGQQATDMAKTPLDMQSACSLGDQVFSPTRTLSHGLPILEWRPDGDRKELLDYRRNVQVSRALFYLPPGYLYYIIAAQGMLKVHPPNRLPGISAGTNDTR